MMKIMMRTITLISQSRNLQGAQNLPIQSTKEHPSMRTNGGGNHPRPNQTVTTRPPGQPEKIIKTKNITNSHEGDRRLADEATKLITVQEKIKTIKVLKL